MLVDLERRGLLKTVITQNIDGLHTAAGTRDLIEVHGTVASSSCLADGHRYTLDEVRARMDAGVPRCDCGRPLKPDVVLFGELLPEAAIDRAYRLAGEADLMLCVGSSLEVYPVAQLPRITLGAGGQVALVTMGPTPYDAEAAVKLDGDVAEEMTGVLRELDD